VVLVLYANDLPAPELDASSLATPLAPRPPRSWPRVLEVARRIVKGIHVPRRWHARPFPFLPATPDPRNPWTANAPAFDFVDPRIADCMRRGTFNPFVVDLASHYARTLAVPIDPLPLVRALRDHVRARGATLRLAYVPCPYQVSDRYLPFVALYSRRPVRSLVGDELQQHERALARACASLEVPFLPLTDELRAKDAVTPLYWDHDEHMRPEGYRVVAERLARFF
jgi:hypothetical protein